MAADDVAMEGAKTLISLSQNILISAPEGLIIENAPTITTWPPSQHKGGLFRYGDPHSKGDMAILFL